MASERIEPGDLDLGVARRIASEWHGGQFTALYALSSSGTLVDGIEFEITRTLADADPAQVGQTAIDELRALEAWVALELAVAESGV